MDGKSGNYGEVLKSNNEEKPTAMPAMPTYAQSSNEERPVAKQSIIGGKSYRKIALSILVIFTVL